MDSCGLPLGRPAFSMKTLAGGLHMLPSQFGENMPQEPCRSSCVPNYPPLSPPNSPLLPLLPTPLLPSLCLSLTQSVENFCLIPGLSTSFQSGAALSYLSPLSSSSSPSSFQT